MPNTPLGFVVKWFHSNVTGENVAYTAALINTLISFRWFGTCQTVLWRRNCDDLSIVVFRSVCGVNKCWGQMLIESQTPVLTTQAPYNTYLSLLWIHFFLKIGNYRASKIIGWREADRWGRERICSVPRQHIAYCTYLICLTLERNKTFPLTFPHLFCCPNCSRGRAISSVR